MGRLAELECLVAVIDNESFSEAARRDRRDHLVGPGDPRVEERVADVRDADALRAALGDLTFMSFYGSWDIDDTGKQIGHWQGPPLAD